MFIGSCSLELWLMDCQSLKGKRRIIKSMIHRIQCQFNVSIAEVGHLDRWQRATIGLACVGNEQQHIQHMLQKVIQFIETNYEAEITDYVIEIY
ncbi:MAG: DUF503 domain-containing protein [Limnochordia bacterium]